MTTIAVCGLGLLGRPIAERLLHSGHDLRVWNRTPEKARPLADSGASVARTPAEAAAGAEVAITVLSTPDALNDVALGPDGLAEGLAPGSILAEMSTVGPDAIRNLAMGLPTQHATAAEAHHRLMLTKAFDLSARKKRAIPLPIVASDEAR